MSGSTDNHLVAQIDAPPPWYVTVSAAAVFPPEQDGLSLKEVTMQTAGADIVRFPQLTLADLLAKPSKPWLIDQIIGAGDLGMIYGPPGSGKTFVAIDLIFSACLGKSFGGRFAAARPLTVAYACDEGGTGLAQRFRVAAEYYGVNPNCLPGLIIFMNVPQLYNMQDPANAERFVEEYAASQAAGKVAPLDLLVLDTQHSATVGADENSSQHIGEVLHRAKGIAGRLSCAVFLIHHTNRAGTGERGSSALRGAMDIMIEVKQMEGSHLMSCTKLKDGEMWKPQTFDLVAKADSVRVEWGGVGDAGKSPGQKALDKARLLDVMYENPGVKFTSDRLAEAIGKTSNHTRNLLAKLVHEDQCMRELSDQTRQLSNRNPWVYFLASTG